MLPGINRLFSEDNELTGSIPAAFGDLTKLTDLHLGKWLEIPRTVYNIYISYSNAILHPTNIVFLCFRNQSFMFRV